MLTWKKKLLDWKFEDGVTDVDDREWDVALEEPLSLKVSATNPDGHECLVWIEVSDGKLVEKT